MQHLSSARINKFTVGALFCLAIFITYIPLIAKVNFMQNDDWYYYSQVALFLQGSFRLIPQIAPIFYLQGIIASLFSLFFGLNSIPVLTLFVALLNVYIFYLILTNILENRILTPLLLSAIFFFNPLFQYSLIGFMTEQYFLLFLLCSIYLFLKYQKIGTTEYLIASNISIFLGFLVRQVSVVFSVTAFLYFLINRKWKTALYQAFFSLFLLFLYILIPKTPEMLSKTYQLHHLLNFHYIYAVLYAVILYLTAFSIPILIVVLTRVLLKTGRIKLLAIILLAVTLYLVLQIPFRPMSVSWGEFPYFENTWERTGFLPRDIIGTKYQFKGIFDLYGYWDTASKIVLSIFISTLLLIKDLRKKLINFEAIYIFVYILLMFFTVTFYDRYIIIMLPVALIWLAKMFDKNRFFENILMGFFVIFIAFYSLNLTSDFVLRENYIWSRATKLQGEVSANSAWNEKNNINPITARYLFSYDSPKVGGNKLEGFTLIEVKDIKFPFSFFIQPRIYLYEKSL
jgi:hypothetical protein